MQKTKVALFPLQLFLLPGEKTRLHIFEPRYKQLLLDCSQEYTSFGIPFVKKNAITGYGSLVKVVKEIGVHADGASDIEIICEELFKIEKFHERLGDKLYPGGDVHVIENADLPPMSEDFMNELGEYLQKTEHKLIPELLSTHLTAFHAGSLVGLSDDEKYNLVRSKNQASRERFLINKLRMLNKIQDQLKSIKGEIFLN